MVTWISEKGDEVYGTPLIREVEALQWFVLGNDYVCLGVETLLAMGHTLSNAP